MDAAKELAAAIMLQAVSDWRTLTRAEARRSKRGLGLSKPDRYCNFNELRIFFNSRWCDTLLSCSEYELTGPMILEKLERERAEALGIIGGAKNV